ncbi:MAG: hypothetical protein Q9159_000154 [Coniocarpon cinnabarinum]
MLSDLQPLCLYVQSFAGNGPTSTGFDSSRNLEAQLNAKVFNAGYTISWLNGTVPSFTTEEYTLKPFSVPSLNDADGQAGYLEAETTSYFTELTCSAAKPSACGERYLSNGAGCDAWIEFESDIQPNTSVQYMGWSADWGTGLQGSGLTESTCTCGPEHSDVFFASCSSGEATTALFCQPAYHQQQVRAKIWIENSSVIRVAPSGDAAMLSLEDFNSTSYNYFLGNAVSALSEVDASQSRLFGTFDVDIIDALIPSEVSRLKMQYPDVDFVSNMASLYPWAFTGDEPDFKTYTNATRLANAFEKAHKLLFALAVNTAMRKMTDTHEVEGTYARQRPAITVNIVFAPLSATALILLALLALATLLLDIHRPMQLAADPAALVDQFGIVSASLQDRLKACLHEPTSMGEGMMHDVFRIEKCDDSSPDPDVKVEVVRRGTHTSSSKSSRLSKTSYPIGMNTLALLLLLAIVIAAVAILFALKWKMDRENGLSIPSQNSFVRPLLLSYIPTAFATMLELAFVMLTRDACYLEPFINMARRGIAPEQSIDLNLTAVPAQFSVFRALKRGRHVISFLCIVTLSTNVLVVVMSGLFRLNTVTVTSPQRFAASYAPVLDTAPPMTGGNTDAADGSTNSNYDYFYMLDQSMAVDPTFPPWTNEDYFFVPFDLPNSSLALVPEAVRRGRTVGFGVSATCEEAGSTARMEDVRSLVTTVSPYAGFREDEAIHKSSPNKTQCDGSFSLNFYDPVPSGAEVKQRLAAETVYQLGWPQELNDSDDQLCSPFLIVAWLRMNPLPGEGKQLLAENATQPAVAGTVLSCQSKFVSGTFDVSVDAAGKIIGAAPVGQLESDPSPRFANAALKSLYEQVSSNWLGGLGTNRDWHQAVFAGTWLNYFISILQGSKDIVDPSNRVKQRFFAVYLALNRQLLVPKASDGRPATTNADAFDGTVGVPTQRIFYAPNAFELAIALLSAQIPAIVLLLLRRLKQMLPRMPTTIAAVVSYALHSHMLDDVVSRRVSTDQIKSRSRVRFAYGSFQGTDAQQHTGIDYAGQITCLEKSGHGWRKRNDDAEDTADVR